MGVEQILTRRGFLAPGVFAAAGVLVWVALAADRNGAANRPSVEGIADEPAAFANEWVTVEGKIQRLLGPHAFTIGEDELLVVTAPGPFDRTTGTVVAFDEGASVEVTGFVRIFGVRAAERELRVDLREERLREFAGRPAIVAGSLAPAAPAAADTEA